MKIHSDIKAEIRLAEQVASGDERAFREFYDSYADPLYLFIYHLMNGNKEDAEEVWQDTLMAVTNNMAQYRGESRLFSWMCAIARRKVVDKFRKSAHILAHSAEDIPEITNLPDDRSLPEEILSNNAVRARVVESLNSLPQEYRETLTARYIDGNGVERISKNMQKSYKATESLLSRARQAFKEAFTRSGE